MANKQTAAVDKVTAAAEVTVRQQAAALRSLRDHARGGRCITSDEAGLIVQALGDRERAIRRLGDTTPGDAEGAA